MSLKKRISLGLACLVGVLFGMTPPAGAQTNAPPPDILLDAADATTGWRGQNTLSLDTQIKKRGSASMKSVGANKDRFRKVFATPVDVSRMRYLTFWYYVDKPALLGAVGGTKGQIEISSSGTFDEQEQNWSVGNLHLQRGWNFVVLDLPGTHRGATPINLTRVNHFRIYHAPTASLTTRIDQLVFTNTDPRSAAYTQLLEKKRVARSPAAVELEDSFWALVSTTTANSARRRQSCRGLRIDLTHREITGYSLQNMGVSEVTVRNELREKQLLKEFMCGERTMARAEVLARLQARASTEVAVANEIASLFDLTSEAAAETKESMLEIDLNRIISHCNADTDQVERYVLNGTVPAGMVGANVLVRGCSGTSADIALGMGALARPVSDRRGAYQRCMAEFTSQGAECDNPYANPDDDYDRRINRIYKTPEERDEAKRIMKVWLDSVESYTVDESRSLVGATYPDPGHPETERLGVLHGEYDRSRAQIWYLDNAIDALDNENVPVPGETDEMRTQRIERHDADKQRLKDERSQRVAERQDKAAEICYTDPDDPICTDPEPPGTTPSTSGPSGGGSARCASMQFSDGQTAWFNKPPGASGFPSQINEADRIDHCLCELFDRSYSSLPGSELTTVGGCPTPEERAAQKCLENPDDGRGGTRPECRFLMQPISLDRDALDVRRCEKILPNCDNTYLKADNSCGCATPTPTGGITFPGCTNIPNCPDGMIPSATLCGACAPANSGASQCTKGGKDFYLTRDPLNDLKVRVFPSQPNYATDHILLAKEGDVSIVTTGIKRSQVRDASRFWITAVLPGKTYDGTGKINVSCTNLATGVSNRLIETIQMSTLSSTMPTLVPVNLSSAERTACFGTNPSNEAHFEFFVDSKVGQPVGFFDILDGIGSIKPPCVDFPPRPTPGPRPFSDWPAAWTLSDGATITPRFNGVGTMPTPSDPPPPAGGPLFPVCIIEGVFVPCP